MQEEVNVACTGAIILAFKGGLRYILEQYKKRANMYVMPLFCILFSRHLQLVINNPLLVCGFFPPSVKSSLNPCKLLPTASCGQEVHCLATLCKGPSPVYFEPTFW